MKGITNLVEDNESKGSYDIVVTFDGNLGVEEWPLRKILLESGFTISREDVRPHLDRVRWYAHIWPPGVPMRDKRFIH